MIVAKILHDKAMEFVDEAKLAAMEGNTEAALTFYQKAFALEKEAVEHLPTTPMDDITPYLYRRSAAWLAFQSGDFVHAKQMMDSALSGNPPDFIRQQLEDLQARLTKTPGATTPKRRSNGKKTTEYSLPKTEILTTLEKLENTNSMIAYHRQSKEPDLNAIEDFQHLKHNFLRQLAELLKRFEVEVRLPAAA